MYYNMSRVKAKTIPPLKTGISTSAIIDKALGFHGQKSVSMEAPSPKPAPALFPDRDGVIDKIYFCPHTIKETDIMAGKKAGLKTCLIADKKKPLKVKPDIILPSLSKLAKKMFRG